MSYPPVDAKNLFMQALELSDPAERAGFLQRACGDDLELRARVEVLLRSHDAIASFLGRPAMAELGMTVPGPGSLENQAAEPANAGDARSGLESLRFLQPCASPGRIGKLGNYEVLEVVGQGGMGIVLKAHDTKLNRIVAIKVLTPDLSRNAAAAKRFLREAQAAAAVSHDRVVTIFAVEEASVPPYLVMEYIEGQSLQQKIDRCGMLGLAEILRIGTQMASGLAAAHRQGLVHRDIKPANILLENGVERVKITDFGLARAADDVAITQTGHIAGTPQYMSPEQASGGELDARSDLFSLGSVLYTMCTGRPAFRAESAVAVLRRVCDDHPRPIAEINPEIPDWLCAVIEKLMAKRPEDRYETAAEVAELLNHYLAWVHQQPRAASAVAVPPLPAHRRHPTNVVYVLLATSLVVVLGLALSCIAAVVGYLYLGRVAQERDTATVESDVFDGQPLAPDFVEPRVGPTIAVFPFDANAAQAHQETWAGHLGMPVEFTDERGLAFRLLPPSRFEMGCTREELNTLLLELEQRGESEFAKFVVRSSVPRHVVQLTQPFYLAKHEVTLAQFRAFVEATGYRSTLEDAPASGFTWKSWDIEGASDEQPVWGVSWEDARSFCRWLSDQHDRLYSLPTEAQWEYACRAGSAASWSFGSDPERLEAYAVCGNKVATAPMPVGSKLPNAFGLHDMHGNVDEWCLDWHSRDFYARLEAGVDPVCSDTPDDPASGRVVRGGNFSDPAWWTRAFVRGYDFPATPVKAKGFRVAIVGRLQNIPASGTKQAE